MRIEKEILIQAPLQDAYEAYANILGWKNILEDVVRIELFYDDSIHQEFEMTVLRNAKEETVRSVRFCYPQQRIEIFQTRPPPLFRSMSGVWQFTPSNGDVIVRATREFELKENAPFDGALLGKFLEKNLSSFKNWIEHCACTHC